MNKQDQQKLEEKRNKLKEMIQSPAAPFLVDALSKNEIDMALLLFARGGVELSLSDI